MKLPLSEARICLECDTIHDLQSCPECGSATFYFLSNWIRPRRPPVQEEQAPPPETPLQQMLKPKKKGHILRNTALAGAGLIAAYTLLFKPSKKKTEDEEG